jgi:chemotaxis protein methyltransferase CheR
MTISDQGITRFIEAIKKSSSYDFSDYSYKSLKRRVGKILNDNKLNYDSLIKKISDDNDFLENTIREVTVNTTELFRDSILWQTIKHEILPKFKDTESLRIWHAGCSTGQEVYSMLILLNELNIFENSTVYGTDLNAKVIEEAKKGIYKYRFNLIYLDNFDKVVKQNPNNKEFRDIPYDKYLEIDKIKDTIKIKNFLLKKPIFLTHDLVNPIEFGKEPFHIILCRNVVIYFNYNLQNRVFDFFHKSLIDKGYLILGSHETILGTLSEKFEKLNQINIKK